MSAVLEELKRRRKLYLDAEEAILVAGQDYKIGGRTFTRANLKEIKSMIDRLEIRISQLDPSSSGGRRLGTITGIRVIPKND